MKPPYGVVLIGMALEGMDSESWDRLYCLINKASAVVIEYPQDWKISISQFNDILSNTNKEIVQKVRLDFEGNDFGDLSNSWPARVKRNMYLLKK